VGGRLSGFGGTQPAEAVPSLKELPLDALENAAGKSKVKKALKNGKSKRKAMRKPKKK